MWKKEEQKCVLACRLGFGLTVVFPVCCIYHKPRAFDESSSESDSSDSDTDSDSSCGKGHSHSHRHKEAGSDRNAYEREPEGKGKGRAAQCTFSTTLVDIY